MTTERDHWAEDDAWPVADWKYDVGNGDTRLGYWDWVEHNKDAAYFEARCKEEIRRCHVDPTAGPWTHDDEFCIETLGGGNTIAMTGQDPQLTKAEHEANARAIAALPDVLTALDTLVEVAYPFTTYDSDGESGLADACKTAHAVIKSIKGG